MASQVDQAVQGSSFSFGRNQDITLGVCVMLILAVLIIPVPTWVLDILLSLNISISVVVLLATIYLRNPVEFAIFPSMLLILTLFRLSLNVAATRLILANGDAGSVINAFGSFVTSGSYVVGFIMFSILIVIQFVVITRGAGRISEVAARFTLDAMPGKQMGVDADLNAGLINEEQARARRRGIEQEADFYGAMDGATKFVRGDAIAGIIITLVNIVGGLIIGMLLQGLAFTDALQLYTRLTIGDGLVSQVPALIVSVAAGMIVTRTASEENLGADFGAQLMRYPRALGVASALLAAFGLVPGMPTMPFLAVAGLLAALAYRSSQSAQRVSQAQAAQEARDTAEAGLEAPPKTEDLLAVDPLKIELGYGLIGLADPGQGGDLLTRIQIIRQQTATKMGFIVPVIRIVDNMRLRANEYRVMLREAEIARYELVPDHFLAMNPGLVEEVIEGIPTREPAFNLQAMWVSRANRDRAERIGYTIVEPSAVLATHLTELIMDHADELLTREDTQHLLDTVKTTAKTVVAELIPNILTLGELQKVLHNLLRERVSVRNLEVILEVLADFGPRSKDTEVLAEYVRHALARQVCADLKDEKNVLHVVTLAPKLEQEILDAAQQADTRDFVPLAPARAEAIAKAAVLAVQRLVEMGYDPVVLTSAQSRRFVRRIVERHMAKVIVLSYNEVDSALRLESEGQIEA